MNQGKLYRKIAKLDGAEIFYLDTDAKKPAILCIHGRCGRAETWADLMRRYGAAYRVIAADQRGHGLSSKPVSGYTDAIMAEDTVRLMDHLQISSAIVVGHSMGGAVAGYLAAKYPARVKALAILDKSAAGPEKPFPAEEFRRFNPTKDWPMPFSSCEEAAEFLRGVACSYLEYRYFMSSLTETAEGWEMRFSSAAMAEGIANYTGWYHLLPMIKCPVLLIRSGSHEAVPDEDFEKMKKLLPNCAAREMSHPDHNVHLADKEEFYGYFDSFLNSVKE
ncbi:alpha/beta fold hydrolase [Caproicibacter sp.]|uniref:alpha/beta fold hydrolase n=1 Tax=Caproicibacter sp. TaxID=2814884 RepID=UPI00398A2862